MVQGRNWQNYGPDENLDLNTSFERSLSENHWHWINGTKLWKFKLCPPKIWGVRISPLRNILMCIEKASKILVCCVVLKYCQWRYWATTIFCSGSLWWMAVSNDEASLHQGCHGVPGSVVGASLFHCEGGVGVHLGLRYQLCLEQVTMPRWFLRGKVRGG